MGWWKRGETADGDYFAYSCVSVIRKHFRARWVRSPIVAAWLFAISNMFWVLRYGEGVRENVAHSTRPSARHQHHRLLVPIVFILALNILLVLLASWFYIPKAHYITIIAQRIIIILHMFTCAVCGANTLYVCTIHNEWKYDAQVHAPLCIIWLANKIEHTSILNVLYCNTFITIIMIV